MKENRLLLCIHYIHQIGDLGKNNSKYFTFMNYFDRFAIKSSVRLKLKIENRSQKQLRNVTLN
jgi:hypothetical protein